jgi:glycosyltransferase involved in cell wall biosynthesis
MNGVTIIVPAYNAQNTIGETIASVRSQTYPHWELIVVDDGSTDDTPAVVKQFTNGNEPIIYLHQSNQGVAAARNNGIQNARYEWLHFLDADDWVAPNFLQLLTQKLEENPEADAVHCGWNTIAPDGHNLGDKFAPDEVDMFPSFVRACAIAMHACIVRKQTVRNAGSFDPSFTYCSDWDFWQRVARTGARFVAVRQVLAFYRMSNSSLTKTVVLAFETSLRIIRNGHTTDPRVQSENLRYINGMPTDSINNELLFCLTWFAGMFIGQGNDASSFADRLPPECKADISPHAVANYLIEAVCFSNSLPMEDWDKLWKKTRAHIVIFVRRLEALSGSVGLAETTLNHLERMVFHHVKFVGSLVVDSIQGIRIEVTEPIPDVPILAGVDTLYAIISVAGEELGPVEVASGGKSVLSTYLTNEIATKYAWQIFDCFFRRTLHAKHTTGNELGNNDRHHAISWKTFINELWPFHEISLLKKLKHRFRFLETSEVDISDVPIYLIASRNGIEVTAGGARIGKLNDLTKGIISGTELKTRIEKNFGFELCRVSVREALIGHSLENGQTLVARLRSKRQMQGQNLSRLREASLV